MYNRRAFIQGSAAASSAAVLTAALDAWPVGALAGASSRIDFYKVVFDREHPAAVAFGQAAGNAGVAAQAIGRDVTALWNDDLYLRWRQGPAAIAGLTPARVAYCLQVLAQGVGMRMVFRAEHVPTADGRQAHRLTAPRSVLDRASLLDGATNWASAAAELVSNCPADFSAKSTLALSSPSPSGWTSRQPLVSWVMAPPARA